MSPSTPEGLRSQSAFLSLLTSNPDADTMLTAWVRSVHHRYPVVNVGVYGLDAAEETLLLLGHHGLTSEVAAYRSVSLGLDLPMTRAVLRNAPVVVPRDAWTRTYPLLTPVEQVAARDGFGDATIVCVPLVHEGDPIGVFTMITVGGGLLDDEGDVLAGYAAVISMWLWVRMLTERVVGSPRPVDRRRVDARITDRQRQVIRDLAAGVSVSEIARRLGYSTSTVKADIRAAQDILGAQDRGELLRKATSAGIVAVPSAGRTT